MTSSKVSTFSADEVSLSIAGLTIDSGFADGEFVSIEPAADDFADKVGADGEVARSKTNDRRATVKIKLLQTSEGNDKLSALRLIDINNPNGAGVGAFMLRDRSGRLVATAPKAWVMKPPTPSRGREIAEMEWTLRVGHLDLFVGGNPAV